MAVTQAREKIRVRIRTRAKFRNNEEIWTERKEVTVKGGGKHHYRVGRKDKIIAKYV